MERAGRGMWRRAAAAALLAAGGLLPWLALPAQVDALAPPIANPPQIDLATWDSDSQAIVLAWTFPDLAGSGVTVTAWQVSRADLPGKALVVLPGTATAYLDDFVFPGNTYSYTVTAVVDQAPWAYVSAAALASIAAPGIDGSSLEGAWALDGYTISWAWTNAPLVSPEVFVADMEADEKVDGEYLPWIFVRGVAGGITGIYSPDARACSEYRYRLRPRWFATSSYLNDPVPDDEVVFDTKPAPTLTLSIDRNTTKAKGVLLRGTLRGTLATTAGERGDFSSEDGIRMGLRVVVAGLTVFEDDGTSNWGSSSGHEYLVKDSKNWFDFVKGEGGAFRCSFRRAFDPVKWDAADFHRYAPVVIQVGRDGGEDTLGP